MKPIGAKLDLNLDLLVKDAKYSVAEPVQGLIEKPDDGITAINNCILILADVKRTDTILEFTWLIKNPGQYPSYVHIGTPPVIGTDGIIYGFYESPHLVDVPITPAGGNAEWKTKVTVPADVKGLYVLMSVSPNNSVFS
jgi:hypothetical protein